MLNQSNSREIGQNILKNEILDLGLVEFKLVLTVNAKKNQNIN